MINTKHFDETLAELKAESSLEHQRYILAALVLLSTLDSEIVNDADIICADHMDKYPTY